MVDPTDATNGNILMRCADEEGWPYRVFTPTTLTEEGRGIDWTCAHCAWMQTSLAAGCNELCQSATWHSKELYAQYRDEARAGGFDPPDEAPMYEPGLSELLDRARDVHREIHELVDADDAGESEMQVALMRALDAFDEVRSIHERERETNAHA